MFCGRSGNYHSASFSLTSFGSLAISVVATSFAPKKSSTITSPVFNLFVTLTEFITFMASKILSFGISPKVLTGSKGKSLNFVATVEVMLLVGFKTSDFPKASPLLQVAPETVSSPPSSVTVSRHPLGQTIHVSSLITAITPF